jgi:hypothetical protein
MIVIVGTPAEDPVRLLLEAADDLGIATLLLPEAEAAAWNLRVECADGRIGAWLDRPAGAVGLESATGLYLRLTDPRQHAQPDPLREERQQAALVLVCGWADVTGLRVANRPSAMASNSSKPYQAALIRRSGFSVPETLVTNDPDQVRAFARQHGRLVYKSTSGVRSIVHELSPARTAATLDRVRHLPTQFQRLVTGTNVRVHVVGHELFACAIEAETVDYRYADGGAPTSMHPVDLPGDVTDRCRALSAALDLPLAGIDLLQDTTGRWCCFEVNPSPAYSCFAEPTGLPMAAALARWLAGQ